MVLTDRSARPILPKVDIIFCNIMNQSYAAEINVMDHIFNTVSFNAFMICSNFNTSFSRDNAQTTHLSDA